MPQRSLDRVHNFGQLLFGQRVAGLVCEAVELPTAAADEIAPTTIRNAVPEQPALQDHAPSVCDPEAVPRRLRDGAALYHEQRLRLLAIQILLRQAIHMLDTDTHTQRDTQRQTEIERDRATE